jgi:uncharacterized protein YycO
MATFNIRFVSEPDLGSRAIEFFEGGSFWSHTEIILPDGTYLGARLKDGVQIRPTDYIKNINHERRYAIPVTDEALQKMMDFAHAQVGKKYDVSNIAGKALDKNWHHADEWICSELVTATALAGGLVFLNVEPGYTFRITPEQAHLAPCLSGNCTYTYNK